MLTGSGLTGRSGIAMPDEHGRLTEADNDLIQRWWGRHWKDDDPVICPVCKTTDWKTCRASRQHSDARARCQCKQPADLSSHHSHLQILRAFYVFQRGANRYPRAARSATHRRRRWDRGHSWTYSGLGGLNQQTRLRALPCATERRES